VAGEGGGGGKRKKGGNVAPEEQHARKRGRRKKEGKEKEDRKKKDTEKMGAEKKDAEKEDVDSPSDTNTHKADCASTSALHSNSSDKQQETHLIPQSTLTRLEQQHSKRGRRKIEGKEKENKKKKDTEKKDKEKDPEKKDEEKEAEKEDAGSPGDTNKHKAKGASDSTLHPNNSDKQQAMQAIPQSTLT
jgi:hypothetical protein